MCITERYQLLHGTTQQQSPSQRFTPPTPPHNSGSYQTIPAPQQPQEIFNALPAPQQHEEILNSLPTPLPLITHMSPVQPAENYLQQTPLRLTQVSHLADMTSQQYSNPSQQYSHNSHPSGQFSHSSQQYSFPSNQFQFDMESRQNNQGAPVGSLPPIITGFENFSPEQQEKIKAQLSVQFGAPLQPLPVGQNSENGSGEQQNEKNGQYQPKYQFGASSFGQNQERDSGVQERDRGVGQFSPKYQTISTRLNIDEFVPSQQLKNNVGSSSIMHVPKSSYKKM
ncbi:hypothetical protein JTB14_032221 [Gonioctena quinquepunctata]|nr:hypothetical protein JTB14_032221 [Gonioctena quinquepunctata]